MKLYCACIALVARAAIFLGYGRIAQILKYNTPARCREDLHSTYRDVRIRGGAPVYRSVCEYTGKSTYLPRYRGQNVRGAVDRGCNLFSAKREYVHFSTVPSYRRAHRFSYLSKLERVIEM